MPRFVILEHDHPELHWDFMLETGDILRTWRLAQAPGQPDAAIAATSVFDHRPFYLDYEGPVSGGRGTVARWDSGTYEQQIEDTSVETIVVQLEGRRLCGKAILEKQAGDQWLFRPPRGLPHQPET